jgi:Na+/glutamate symporter
VSPFLQFLTVATIGFIFGLMVGAMLGLYVGERGRRKASENRELYGAPSPKGARSIPQPQSAEQRAEDARGYSKEAVKRGAADLIAQAAAIGKRLSKKDAEAEAERMLAEAFQSGPPELGGL